MSMSKFETTLPFHNNVTVTHKRRAKNPSFSSILLDTIYQSIDDDDDHHHHHEYSRTTPTSPTQSISNNNIKQTQTEDYCNIIEAPSSSKHQRTRTKMRSDSTLETVDLRRAIMIESWMEKQHHKKQQLTQIQTQPPPPLLVPHQQQNNNKHHFHLGDVLDQKIRIVRQKSVPTLPTTSSASDSITTTATDYSSFSSSSCFTNLATRSSREQSSSRIFTKTKSRALKIYGDLKRSKQQNNAPISPGRRIAAFLNSIFRNSGNSPARNSPSPSPEMKMSTQTTTTTIASNSTCSSASSFSRSCLSKTTSSSTKSTPATKRSVRFYPVSVIVDEDSRPCGHKSLHKNENEDSKKLVSPQIDSNKWRKEKEIDALMTMMKTNCSENNNNHQRSHVSNFHEDLNDDDEEMEEEDDDDESCASSDLFELENFSSIGVSRYNEELPVYGTTSLKNITATTT